MFGEYMLRYVPILLNNTLTEAFNACMDPISLQYYKIYQTRKFEENKEMLKERLNMMNYVRE